MFPSYNDWMQLTVFLTNTTTETSMEEAMLDFFYIGISPWIQNCGYMWSIDEGIIARKFVHFCYILSMTATYNMRFNRTDTIEGPPPNHRNFPEDLDTFYKFADYISFSNILSEWDQRYEIVGTILDHKNRDFCYVWIDVEYGEPGAWTQATIQMNNEDNSDNEVATGVATHLAESNWSKRKNDIY